MAQLYAGTSGWAYPSWKPDFYPAKLAQAKFLQYYATKLNAVEVNFTFRQLLKETTAQKWIEATPAGFRLSIKAHQVITHIKRLQKTEDFIPRFLSTIEPIARAEKLGPLLFQLPPNMKADARLLEEFLSTLPRAVPSAFEFRHASWFIDEIFALLKSSNRALCVAETEEKAQELGKSFLYGGSTWHQRIPKWALLFPVQRPCRATFFPRSACAAATRSRRAQSHC
jgi:uncharacterized protein YecE (DUF72 family)